MKLLLCFSLLVVATLASARSFGEYREDPSTYGVVAMKEVLPLEQILEALGKPAGETDQWNNGKSLEFVLYRVEGKAVKSYEFTGAQYFYYYFV